MRFGYSFGFRARRMLQGLVTLAAFLGVGNAAFAACNTYYCQGTIALLFVTDTAAYVQMSGGLSGLTNCTPEGGVYLTLPKTHGNYNSLYALLLLTKAQGTPITIRTNDGSAGCTVAYITTP